MLLQPEKIILANSDGVSVNDAPASSQVLIPPASVIHFLCDLGQFRFVYERGSLLPRSRDDRALAELLTEAVRHMPGSGDSPYDSVTWIASSQLTDGDRIIIRKDEFVIGAGLSVFAVGVLEEVSLGQIHKMWALTP